jgi:hypothetical protein
MTSPPADRTVRDAKVTRDGKITRDVVLAAALELVDRDGPGGCPCAASPAQVNHGLLPTPTSAQNLPGSSGTSCGESGRHSGM